MTSFALPRSGRLTVLNAAAWLSVATIVVAQQMFLSWWDPDALGRPLFGRLIFLPLWALATPAILRSGRRWPLGLSRPGNALRHLGHAVGFVVGTNVLVRIPTLTAAGPAPFGESLGHGLVSFGPLAVLIYGAIVALGDAIARRTAPGASPDLPVAEPLPAPTPATSATLTLRDGEALHLIPVADVDLVEADDNYIKVRAAGKVLRSRARLSDVEEVLDPARFLRVHRSAIVAAAAIRAVISVNHGDWAIELADGTRVRVARGRRSVVAKAVEELRAGEAQASRLSETSSS